jgi:ketosteroid isomerase-like protein
MNPLPQGLSQSVAVGHVHAISQLVARFDDAVNRRDVAEFAQLWAPDATWEIGEPMPLHVEGAANIVKTWQQMLGGTQWLFRGSFAGVVDVQGDRASGRWPCIETGTFVDGKGYDNRAMYQDSYALRQGAWLFQSRKYIYFWLSNEKLPGSAQSR